MTISVCDLQAIQEALKTLQPSVESAESEKEALLTISTTEEKATIRKLMDCLHQNWNSVNEDYKERQRYEAHIWGEFH